jgi:hypothetical protein
MKLDKIIEEMIGSSANIRTYSAYETPARKDFVTSNQSDYNYSYQQNIRSGGERLPEPPIKGSIPWPLENIIEDFTNGYIVFYEIGQKINYCINNNKTLTKDQKSNLKKYLRDIKRILDHIKLMGSKVLDDSKIN